VCGPGMGARAATRLAASLWSLTVLLLVGAVLSASALVLRLRQARGDERHQLTWIVLTAALLVTTLVTSFVGPREWALLRQFV
jgi:hypothetical protein